MTSSHGSADDRSGGAVSASSERGSLSPSTAPIRVDVTVPVDATQISLLRSIAGAVAVSLDFDIDTMADLRMAVDELGSTVVTRAVPGTPMRVAFEAQGSTVRVQARAAAAEAASIDEAAFGWMVLTTLTDEVHGSIDAHDGGGSEVQVSLELRAPRAAQ